MRTLLIAPLMLLATLCMAIAAPFSHHQEGHPNAAEVIPLGGDCNRMTRAGEVTASCLQTVHRGSQPIPHPSVGIG